MQPSPMSSRRSLSVVLPTLDAGTSNADFVMRVHRPLLVLDVAFESII
jgi:hypothetical protein